MSSNDITYSLLCFPTQTPQVTVHTIEFLEKRAVKALVVSRHKEDTVRIYAPMAFSDSYAIQPKESLETVKWFGGNL